jgi:hypothetical protein
MGALPAFIRKASRLAHNGSGGRHRQRGRREVGGMGFPGGGEAFGRQFQGAGLLSEREADVVAVAAVHAGERAPISRCLMDDGVVPVPNPVGVPRP